LIFNSAASYLRIIERIRAARPDIAISGDFIVIATRTPSLTDDAFFS
jgi:hypothetical protein